MGIRFLGLSGWLRPWINFIWDEINSFQNFECVLHGPRSWSGVQPAGCPAPRENIEWGFWS